MKAQLQKFWPGLVGALLAASVGWFFSTTNFGLGLVHLSYDVPFAFRETITPSEAVIIYLDETSGSRLDQPAGRAWDRALHAKLLQRLTADGAKSVTYDIFFSDPSPPESPERQKGDALFAEAIAQSGKVILGANFVNMGYNEDSVTRGKRFDLPFEQIVTNAATVASVEMNPDSDLVVREHLPYVDQIAPLAWATAELVGVPVTTNQASRTEVRWINYYGPTLQIPFFPFWRAVSTNANDRPPPPGYFRDKSVFIGGKFITRLASDRKDEFATPYTFWTSKLRARLSESHFMPGVEVHTTIFLNLLRGDWLTRTSDSTESGLMIAVGLIVGFSLTRTRPLTTASLALLSALAVAIIGYQLHARLHLWFPWTILVFLTIPVAASWSIIYNSVALYVQKRLLEQSLSRYLSPKLVRVFANRPEFLRTGAEKQLITILFSDIANFTSMSEGMDSDKLAKLVNSYFDRAVPSCIFKTDGTVIKFIGDAIFAIWNAPEAQSDHQLRACRGALLLRDQVGGFSFGDSLPQLRTRIGLHTGVANVGNFGSAEKFGYDAMGENINLASRMEGLNKYLGTDVLVTGDTYGAITGQLVTRRLGLFRLKGFEKAVEVHELVSELDKASESQEWRELFAKGLECFERKSFEQAEATFRRTLEVKPDDGPSKFYRDRIAELRAHPPKGEWTGIVELKEK